MFFNIKLDNKEELIKSTETIKVPVLKLKKINFTNKVLDIQRCNFFILCVPTPIHRNKTPDLRNLTDATKVISKVLKKNDIVIIDTINFPTDFILKTNYFTKNIYYILYPFYFSKI